jgi:hypothetical protein
MLKKKIIFLKGSNQKGASTIILALIVLVFMSLTAIGITKLTIAEKKRVKSTSVSAEAYQKADEAMECALWGRNEIISNCSDKSHSDDLYYFPHNIAKNLCDSGYSETITPYHLGTENTIEDIPICAGPLYISLFTTKGEAEGEESAFTDGITKQRGVGATVHTSTETGSSLFKPYVCCNKIAVKGEVRASFADECNDEILTDDNGPNPDNGGRGWLEYWEPCGNICEDPCAYYDTSLDPYEEGETDDQESSLYNVANTSEKEGAHWCWTNTDILSSSPAYEDQGSICYCMYNHNFGENPSSDANYWKHPDVEGFCDPCNRLEGMSSACGGEVGSICSDLAENGKDYFDNVTTYEDIWGDLGEPPADCQGTLSINNCYSCNCPNFINAKEDNKKFCEESCGEDYSCRTP